MDSARLSNMRLVSSPYVLATIIICFSDTIAIPLVPDGRVTLDSPSLARRDSLCPSHASTSRHRTHDVRSAKHMHQSRSALNIGGRLAPVSKGTVPKPPGKEVAEPKEIPFTGPPKTARPRGNKGLPAPPHGQPEPAKAGVDQGPGTRRHAGMVSEDSRKTALRWVDMSTNPAAKKPSKSNPIDDGGYEIFDDIETVCEGGGSGCNAEKGIASSWKKKGSWWTDGGSGQRPLSGLSTEERAGLKAEGLEVGAQVVEEAASYIFRKKSKLHFLPKKRQAKRLPEHYDIEESQPEIPLRIFRASKIRTPLRQAGFTNVEDDTSVAAIDVSSKTKSTQPTDPSLVTLLTSKALGLFVVRSRYSVADGNPLADRQYSSTLTWSAWKKAAGSLATKLRGVLNYNVVDQQMNNYIAIAHEDWAAEIADVPMGRDGASLSPIAGRGSWKRGHPAFALLHAGSNVRSNAYMIMEEDTNMDNPYLEEIHTFPRVVMSEGLDNNVPRSAVRETMIVYVYGPRPA